MVVLVFLMVISYWSSHKISLNILEKDPERKFPLLGTMQGSILGLLALIIAFTFNLSITRYDQRREVVVEEANHIGTALLRCDLYPDSIRAEFRKDFKEYVEARISYYEARIDDKKTQESLDKADKISQRIWTRAGLLSKDTKASIISGQQMIPALNNMIDIVTTRDELRTAHIPDSIIWLMISLAVISSFFLGIGTGKKKILWLAIWCFFFVMSVSFYFILDLDRPTQGINTLNATHQKIVDIRKMLD
jgi:hypothetical protein